MPALEIPCPQCGRRLKLPDRSMLGRKGRCGKCGHKFIMNEPPPPVFAEVAPPSKGKVQFEYADDLPDPGSDKTLMGIEVRYVPDESMRPNPIPAAVPAPAPMPRVAEQFAMPETPHISMAVDVDDEPDTGAVARVRNKRKKARQTQMMMVGGVVALVAVAAGIYAMSGSKPKKQVTKNSAAQASKAESDDAEETDEEAPKVAGQAKEKPGQPITLALVPEGAHILIHLRPADLWQAGGSAEEFRACLGPLGEWIESTIKTRCKMPPTEIDEALFALIPASRDTFDVAVVVRTSKDIKRSELIDKFDGELIDKPREHYLGKERAWLIFDNRTYASAPSTMDKETLQSWVEASSPSVTSDGIQAVLSMTDRNRHFTIVCDLEDVRLGTNTLAPENARKFLEGVVDFFGDDVESLAWCLSLGDTEGGNNLRSEVLVRNKLSRSPAKLQADLQKKVAKLPDEVLDLVYMTHPKSIGRKKVVGRFPIMTKIVQRSTKFDTGHRLVSMKVELPERAGPNLALGTVLTWNQTTLPDFGSSSKTAAPVAVAKANLPDKIADRLKKKITVEFRRDFMYKAIEFVAEETGVQIKIDGPGLKEVGLTQNIYQTFSMEDVPATAVLHKIIIEGSMDKGKPQLLLVVDESSKTATITSVPTAEKKKLTPFPLEPAPK